MSHKKYLSFVFLVLVLLIFSGCKKTTEPTGEVTVLSVIEDILYIHVSVTDPDEQLIAVNVEIYDQYWNNIFRFDEFSFDDKNNISSDIEISFLNPDETYTVMLTGQNKDVPKLFSLLEESITITTGSFEPQLPSTVIRGYEPSSDHVVLSVDLFANDYLPRVLYVYLYKDNTVIDDWFSALESSKDVYLMTHTYAFPYIIFTDLLPETTYQVEIRINYRNAYGGQTTITTQNLEFSTTAQ